MSSGFYVTCIVSLVQLYMQVSLATPSIIKAFHFIDVPFSFRHAQNEARKMKPAKCNNVLFLSRKFLAGESRSIFHRVFFSWGMHVHLPRCAVSHFHFPKIGWRASGHRCALDNGARGGHRSGDEWAERNPIQRPFCGGGGWGYIKQQKIPFPFSVKLKCILNWCKSVQSSNIHFKI